MRAVVLVGGFGTRLRPLTLSTPKQMLPVAGRPMIEWVVAHLAAHGVDEVVLSLGYRPDAFRRAYPDATCAGVRLVYAVEPEPLDTAGAIRFAAGAAGIDERFLVANGDVLTDIDLSALMEFHARVGASGTLQLTPVEDPSSFGVVATDDDGRVRAFVEKPAPGEAPSSLISAGFYVLEPEVLDRIPEGGRVNVEREVFPGMVGDGVLWARAEQAWWIDVGTPDRYLQASLDLLDREPPPSVVRSVDAMVATSAVVRRSAIGPGARVGPRAVVEDSVVFARGVVESDAVVRRSVVGSAAVVGRGAVVRDVSVLGNGTEVAEGAELAGVLVPGPESW
ncbi:MAG TPA: NDP-sugar synthase [Acidimicrobiales bacterium]|nr:NDP-sugar synthase [Acidimicrobiales bacterium]